MVEQVGRYKIERELGRGGMGVVYLANDPMLGRRVAIKTIHFEITDAAQREYLRTQLLRDARASAGLSHPNVVNVHDILESGDTTYLVMEYIAGETLLSRIHRPPAPDAAWLLRVLRDIAAALDYTHRKGVVHRDIKPGNIMIDQHARVRIMDFGLARATAQSTASSTGMVAGTIQYMSPEQIRGEALDGRADQFSMAAVAYEMLTGKPLFEALSPVTLAQKILNETPLMAHVQNPQLREATSAVLAKALDRQPQGRYPTCTAFVDALIATFYSDTLQAVLRPPEEQPTVALTGMMDVGADIRTAPKETTAPVHHPGKWSGHAPLLIGVGLIVGALGVTTVTLINGRSHGDVPKPPEQARYGPPPLIGNPGEPHHEIPPKPPIKPPGAHHPLPQPLPEPPPPIDDGRPHRDHDKSARRRRWEDFTGEIPRPPDLSKVLLGPESGVIENGKRQLANGNFGIAVQLFSVAVKMVPGDYHAYLLRGEAHLGAGNPRQAQTDYEKVVELQPDFAQGWYQLGVAMEHQHHLKEAIDNYTRAATLKPDMADAYYACAMIYDQQLAPKKALAQLDKAIAANPKYIRGYQARAELKKSMGDPTAQDDLQTAKDLIAERRSAPPDEPPDRKGKPRKRDDR
jgi:serine/threonine protein kinase/Flp pilus assembly protein TadD